MSKVAGHDGWFYRNGDPADIRDEDGFPADPFELHEAGLCRSDECDWCGEEAAALQGKTQ